MKKIAISLALLVGCDAYHRHPAATVAASAGLVAGAAGMTIGCGFVNDDSPNWQDTAEHQYGIAYVGLVTTVAAAIGFALLYPDENRW